jgi:hypothetical protein
MISGAQWIGVTFAVVWPPVYGCLMVHARRFAFHVHGRPAPDRRLEIYRWWAIAALMIGLPNVVLQQWPAAVCAGVNAAVTLWLWWWRRRGWGRAARAYGAKSWARLARLVRDSREALRRRPRLRPAPGGAS